MNIDYELIIIGAGPAGLTAAIYATRANIKTLMVEEVAPGGKLLKTYEIENYPGIAGIAGSDLAIQMMEHSQKFGADLEYSGVKSFEDLGDYKKVILENGKELISKAVIVATGTNERQLDLPNAEKLVGRGISYCAVCDGAFYKGKDVVIIGGGNSALEEAIYLTQLVNSVTIIIRRDQFRAAGIVVEKVKANDKIKVITKSLPNQIIIGEDGKVAGLEIKNVDSGELRVINCQGIFPYIGADPSTKFLKDSKVLDDKGYIIVNDKMETSIPGLYAAGDVTVKDLRQVVTATNDGAIAGNNASRYIND